MTTPSYPRLSATQLDDIATAHATDGPWPGYPALNKRFFHAHPRQLVIDNVLHVPKGDWHIQGHPNRQDVDTSQIDPELSDDQVVPIEWTKKWQSQGLMIDQNGRPVHPHWEQLLADTRIGLPTGLGMFYRYGPNTMVDPVIYRYDPDGQPLFLLIRQRVTGKWGFPGGFVDPTDSSYEAAARRETAEEAGLDNLGGTAEIILQSLPLRRRDTLHAWSEVVVLVIHADQAYLHATQPVAGDDADDVGWFTQTQIAALHMQDTHLPYLAKAMSFLREDISA